MNVYSDESRCANNNMFGLKLSIIIGIQGIVITVRIIKKTMILKTTRVTLTAIIIR